MASLWKHPKSPYWSACYTNHLGKQVKRSTKQKGRKEAQKLAQAWEDLESQARRNRLTTVQIQKVSFDLVEKMTGENLSVPTVEAYLNDWLASKKAKGSAGGTIRRYDNTIRLFLGHLGDLAKAPLTAIAPRHIESFLDHRLTSGCAPKTAIVDMKTLAVAFKRAERFSLILKTPVSAVDLPKSESIQRETFAHDEIRRLIAASFDYSPEWPTVIMLGAFTGARLGDCVSMKWNNLDPAQGFLNFRQGKTRKVIAVPVHPDLFQQLQEAWLWCETRLGRPPGPDDFLAPELAKRGGGGKNGLSETFKRIMQKAGIDTMNGPGSGARSFCRRSFHSLRYSFNTALADNGVSQEIRVKLTGHSSFAMNDRYTKLAMGGLTKAIATLPNFNSDEAATPKP